MNKNLKKRSFFVALEGCRDILSLPFKWAFAYFEDANKSLATSFA